MISGYTNRLKSFGAGPTWGGRSIAVAFLAFATASGCGDASHTSVQGQSSAGQVLAAPAPKTTRYAATRFLEQVSFGATASDVERVRAMGLPAWLDAQLAAPATLIDGTPTRNYDERADPKARVRAYQYLESQWYSAALKSEDQLRLRVSWSLSQFLVVSMSNGYPFGLIDYFNMLQRNAFGNYGSLLKAMALHPAMGMFLDNISNRSTKNCIGCAANENFARELMQLFSLGLVKLNPDGTTQRDARGKPLETYTQQDVAELARALTGWEYAKVSSTDVYAHFGSPLAATQPLFHDMDRKSVLGTTFPAGQSAERDLDQVIEMLMAHPNIGPFVSLRLIQHLVTSNPSPGYVQRVAAVFRNNGKGVAGDLAAVVKAILLDSEARRGDAGFGDVATFGKLREPMLYHTALLRGLGCKATPFRPSSEALFRSVGQEPFFADSVFSFYAPSDTAPGSNLLAPEQRLLTGFEFVSRTGSLTDVQLNWGSALRDAGCDLQPFVQAASRSSNDLIDLIGQRWFRSALPAAQRSSIEAAWRSMSHPSIEARVAYTIQFALVSPQFGAMY